MNSTLPNRQVKPIHVLLVEDNIVEARLLQEMLRDSKVSTFEVTRVERLAEAVETAKNDRFDVILLDLSLPDASGIETFRRLHHAVDRTPIVVLTGLEDETIALTALQEGAQDYLTKQFADIHVIDRAVRYAVQRKQAEAERLELIRAQDEQARELLVEQAARREAEKANELKMRFLAMISHELRTPLSSIKGFVSTLLADDVEWDLETQQNFLRIIEQEADKLTELVEQLLDLARLEAGTLRIEAEAHSLEKIFELAAPQLVVVTSEHKLEIAPVSQLPAVLADPLRIAQVLVNLVNNAAQSAPAGTVITIEAHARAGQIQIDVRDEGRGIPEDLRPFVFEAFRQGQDNVSKGKGMGLGLAICKGIVEAHGGSIWVGENEGPGAVISFTLPVAVEEPA
ncbi:MAG: ATP-binding protein [Chloroflexota bacterium]|nr:MAG: hypothetical protein DIU68_03300 [Chloroflexota bacterium]